MTTPEFAARLKAKLETTAEHWRAKSNDPYGISTTVYVCLSEVAECISQALKEPKSKRRKRK